MCVRLGGKDEQCLIGLTQNVNGPNPFEIRVTTHSPQGCSSLQLTTKRTV